MRDLNEGGMKSLDALDSSENTKGLQGDGGDRRRNREGIT